MIFISEIIRSYSCLYQLSLRLITGDQNQGRPRHFLLFTTQKQKATLRLQSHVEKIAGLTSDNLYNEKMEPHMVVKLHRH